MEEQAVTKEQAIIKKQARALIKAEGLILALVPAQVPFSYKRES
jgi:hypothetical protein